MSDEAATPIAQGLLDTSVVIALEQVSARWSTSGECLVEFVEDFDGRWSWSDGRGWSGERTQRRVCHKGCSWSLPS